MSVAACRMPRANTCRCVLQILGVTDDFVAVNKPACVPVHTVGQYRKNTVMGIVQVRVGPCVGCVWARCRYRRALPEGKCHSRGLTPTTT